MKQLLVLGCLVIAAGCTTSRDSEVSQARPSPIQVLRMRFILGDTNVHALVYQQGRPSPTFINAYDMQDRAARAVMDVAKHSCFLQSSHPYLS